MNVPNESLLNRLAVCSWSLQSESAARLLQHLKAIGIAGLQCDLDPIRENPDAWANFKDLCAEAGVALISGMFRTVGEDYSTMESIRITGGLVPDATWDENWNNIQAAADVAADLQINLVTFHAGFLPHQESDPDFEKLLQRMIQVADLFAARQIRLGLETGQETADTLVQFLTKLNRPNVGVNFDPANMILYDKGNPIDALNTLSPWLEQCHIKDAKKTLEPGTWGEEVVVGTGEVDWQAFLQTLHAINYSGYFAIEREAGEQRVQDIRAARDFWAQMIIPAA